MEAFPATPALLHSLNEFLPLFMPLLESERISSVCEIGSGSGDFSQSLIGLARNNKLSCVTVIDPYPPQLPAREEETLDAQVQILPMYSDEALPGLAPHDLYFVDGDHNYYTVSQELRLISQTAPTAIICLHDVGWPAGRRDQYFNPDRIPEEYRHPFSFEGSILPNETELTPSGFRSNGAFAIALNEGGPRNGVLTAVEDFLAENSEYRAVVVPVIFGLAILFREGHPLSKLIHEMVPSDAWINVLRRLDANRLSNWLARIKLQDNLQELQESLRGSADASGG